MSKKWMMLVAAGLLGVAVYTAAAARSDDNKSSQDQRPTPAFSTLDKNHDGRLTRSEVPHDMHVLRRKFHSYDRDGNGWLSRREYQAYLHPTAFRRMP